MPDETMVEPSVPTEEERDLLTETTDATQFIIKVPEGDDQTEGDAQEYFSMLRLPGSLLPLFDHDDGCMLGFVYLITGKESLEGFETGAFTWVTEEDARYAEQIFPLYDTDGFLMGAVRSDIARKVTASALESEPRAATQDTDEHEVAE